MVPKLLSAGKSFKGLARYLMHDANAETKERVAWTHTLNLAHDDVGLAVDEMLWTSRAAEMLKREAGIRAGGRPLENPVKHFSLNWHPSEEVTRDDMVETVRDFLNHMGWSEHQALIVCHNDRHPHVHVMLNAVHPENGRALDTGFERRRAQEWAFRYEREHFQIFCEERLLPKEEREPSPTREAWQKLKEAEQQHDRREADRVFRAWDYFERNDAGLPDAAEWKLLKAMQQQERKAFFAQGKEEFRALRNAIFREVRTEFREEWRDYYAAMRKGESKQRLAGKKRDIISRQNKELESRRDPACNALREKRDDDYAAILYWQREDRVWLKERQARGIRSFEMLDCYVEHRQRLAERQAQHDAPTNAAAGERWQDAAGEVCSPSPELAPVRQRTPTEFFEEGGHEHFRIRGPVDSIGGLGLGALGALSGIMERLFDGFLGGAPTPKSRQSPPPDQSKPIEPQRERRARATTDKETATLAQTQEAAEIQAYWEERRRRGRERD